MAQRGRKAAAALAVAAPVEQIPRAAPPGQLSDFEASIWQQVVATKPADWFQADTHPLLVSYCKHVGQMAHVDRLVADCPPVKDDEDLKRLDMLYKMRDRESRAISGLARSMRLTQQSRYTPQRSATVDSKVAKAKPWAT